MFSRRLSGEIFIKVLVKERVLDEKLLSNKSITKEDYFQMQRYLQASGLEVGLIVNFRESHLKLKRVLNTKLYSEHSDAFVDSDR